MFYENIDVFYMYFNQNHYPFSVDGHRIPFPNWRRWQSVRRSAMVQSWRSHQVPQQVLSGHSPDRRLRQRLSGSCYVGSHTKNHILWRGKSTLLVVLFIVLFYCVGIPLQMECRTIKSYGAILTVL